MDSKLCIDRVTGTPAALTALARLREQRGPVLLYQAAGCLPICFEREDLLIGDGDVLLGRVGDCPVYADDRQDEVWRHAQLIVDVSEGEPEGFCLPAGDNDHFVIRNPGHRDGTTSTTRERQPI